MPRLGFQDAETEIPNTPSVHEAIKLESKTWQAVRRYKPWFEREAGMKLWRNFVLGLAAIAAIVSYLPLASAQQQPQPLKVTKIKDTVYWV
jgi:anti-sigma-K factor RskA